MIVDAHVFAHPKRDGFGPAYDATLDHLLGQLGESPVEKALLLPIICDCPYIKNSENAFVAECCQRHPDKLAGFASVHPIADPNAVHHLDEAIQHMGLQGLKLHPRFQGYAASDDRIVPVIQKAAELGIPVAIDCMLWKPTPLDMQLPFHIDALSKKVPEAIIIMCHTGGWRFLDALAVAKANDNVFVDLALILEYFDGTPFEDQFIFVLKQIGAERIIYGSDHPQSPLAPAYDRARAIITRHGFTSQEQQAIFGGTIARLISL